MKSVATTALVFLGIPFFITCKQRTYNQSSLDTDQMVTLCQSDSQERQTSLKNPPSALRVSCQGSCAGDDYSSRRFYISDATVIAGLEFEARYKNGISLRNLYLFDPQGSLSEFTKRVQLGRTEMQNALRYYGLDETQVLEVTVPANQRILLLPGTRASLTSAGRLDGGTLDCRGQPIDGSQMKSEFRHQNLNQVKRSATLKSPE